MNREEEIAKLKSKAFDLLIIGGGATGVGVALDAASRGLKTALVEKTDFSSGTSSRSTKLIHGGVRYLEQAVLKFDRSQFRLVRDALHERATLLKIAPHLARPLPILTPLYNRIEIPYYRTGLKLYDRLAGKSTIHKSYFVGAKEAHEKFPMLKKERLRGGVIYYDGQFDDSRMNVSIAISAVEQGAAVANHVEVVSLLKKKGRLCGAKVKDNLTGEEWDVQAKVIVNAAGPFLDSIRKMDEPAAEKLLSASSGTHIVLESRFSPPNTGLLIPKTEDGRVLFLLPWLGHTLIGTTDNPAPIGENPKPSQEDIDFILRQIRRYFSLQIDKSDIRSAWTGLRPLVSNPKAHDTAKLSRDHVINVSDAGLVTIAGGKWTTYRKMALDTVDQAVKTGKLTPKRGSQTEKIFIAGGEDFTPKGFTKIQKKLNCGEPLAQYLHRAYGSRGIYVAQMIKEAPKPLAKGHAYTEGEVLHAIRNESARSTADILGRRLRLSFLDREATRLAIPTVSALLGKEMGWDQARIDKETESAKSYLE